MIFTSEQVSKGHPDKLCDQISDAILTEALKQDKKSKVAIETFVKDDQVIIGGELTTKAVLEFREIVSGVFAEAGYTEYESRGVKPGFELYLIISEQSPDIALGVDTGGAGDQGMMFGYATNETKQYLPLPFVLATRALENLREYNSPKLGPDAKAQVSYDYHNGRIDTFLISTQHKEETTLEEVREIAEEVMAITADEFDLNNNFKKLVNPTGEFVTGGPFADTGLTGRKIIADTYGGVARHGGGAFSGKDPSKVDRSGAYIARKIAKRIVQKGWADRCELQISYAIGIAEPTSVHVETFGTETKDRMEIEEYVRSYDLTPEGITKELDLLNFDYNKVSSYGHFGKHGLPWE